MIYIIVAIAAVLIIVGIIIYNSLIEKQNAIDNAYFSMDVMLKKRYDLIPQLVETVKGYMHHEKDVLIQLTELRQKVLAANLNTNEKVELDNRINIGLQNIIASFDGKYERQVARAAGFPEALPQCDDELLGNGDPDEPANRQRVTVEDQPDGRLGRDDLRAPPRGVTPWIREACPAHSRSRSSNFGTLPVEVFGSSSRKATALGAL